MFELSDTVGSLTFIVVIEQRNFRISRHDGLGVSGLFLDLACSCSGSLTFDFCSVEWFDATRPRGIKTSPGTTDRLPATCQSINRQFSDWSKNEEVLSDWATR